MTGMIGPLIFTQVFALAIAPQTSPHVPGAPYFLAATLLTTSLLLAYFVTRGAAAAVAAERTPS
jgi:DHA1 family tetracycline resistance protein-like MFS transporter